MKFRDSLLQGTKMYFVVSIIKAVNFKKMNNNTALSSNHTKEY